MNVSSAAASASAMSLGNVQAQASLMVLKKSIDLEAAHAAQLLQAIPQAPQLDPTATVGGRINTFA